MRYFIFDGINSKTYFWTNSIKRPLMPPIEIIQMKAPQRAGSYALPSTLREYTINVTVTAVTNDLLELRSSMRDIAAWLFKEEDKKLVFSDEQDKYYNARVSSETNLNELAATGETTIQFLISDPFAYSETEKSLLFSDLGELTVMNDGTAPVYPLFRVVPLMDLPYIRIDNTTNGGSITLNGQIWAYDVYMFDMAENRVYREVDEYSYMKDLDIEAEFFPLDPGSNDLLIDPTETTGKISARVIFRDRFY